MKAAEPASPAATTLRAALLDYFDAPGKYQLTLRQPTLLFSSIRDILQIASGRGAGEGADGTRLGDAANFFIRAALLYPGADHYAVLGLAPGEVPADLKERYRLLMRMIHPDFAQGSTAWPADAATRVNRAYEVLSSAVLRREYEEQLATARTQRPQTPTARPAFQAASRRVEERRPRMGKKAALVFGLAVGVPALLLLVMPRTEPDHLVQRAVPAGGAQESAQVDPQVAAHASPALASSQRLAMAETPATPPAPVVPAAPVQPAPARAEPSAAPVTTARPAPVQPPAPTVAMAAARPAAPAPTPIPAAVRSVQPLVVAQQRPVEAARPIPLARVEDAPRPAPVAPAAIAPVSLPLPAPVPVAVPAPLTTAAVVTTAAPSTMPAAKLTATLAVPSVPAPTLADAQPLLTQVLQMLESGNGEQLLRLLDGEARRQPAAVAFSRQYDQLIKGGHPVHLTHVEFAGEPREGGVLLVTGKIRLHAGEPTIGSFGQKLLLRAEFAQRGGRVQLTALSGTAD